MVDVSDDMVRGDIEILISLYVQMKLKNVDDFLLRIQVCEEGV